VLFAIIDGMGKLPRIKVTGAREGDYVVVMERASGVLKIAPAKPGGAPVVGTLRQTTWACPTQWEGTLDDGRSLFVHCRRGELSVGVGDAIQDAIDNGMSANALYFEHVADGPISFEELRAHLYGLLDFPEGLVVDGEHTSGAGLKEALRRHPPDGEWAAELADLRRGVGPGTDRSNP
jgi:hypothetical protein